MRMLAVIRRRIMSDSPTRNRAEPRPTLKTIAGITGLAVATVSRALNDAPDIGEDTKKRVREVARKIGYRPNRAGVRLRTGRTQVIGLVLATDDHMMNHTAQLIYAVSAALKQSSYHLIITPYAMGDDPMDAVRYIVETESADGLILNQIQPNDPRIRYMKEQGFPFAAHGRTDMGLDHPYYDFDNAEFGRLGVRDLRARGRKRLCLIPPRGDQTYAQHMRTGFAEATADLEAEIIENVNSDSSSAELDAEAERIFASADTPDGLLIGSANATMAVVRACEARGLEIGRDVDIVSKEAVQFLRLFRSELIVYHEDVQIAGAFLADAVIRAIEAPDMPPLQSVDGPMDVIHGETARALSTG